MVNRAGVRSRTRDLLSGFGVGIVRILEAALKDRVETVCVLTPRTRWLEIPWVQARLQARELELHVVDQCQAGASFRGTHLFVSTFGTMRALG